MGAGDGWGLLCLRCRWRISFGGGGAGDCGERAGDFCDEAGGGGACG